MLLGNIVVFSLSLFFLEQQNKIVFYFVFLSFSFSIFMLKCRIHYAVHCVCVCECMFKLCVTLTFIAFRNILWGSGAIAFLPKHKHNNSSCSNNNSIIQRKTKAFVLLNCTSDVIEKRNVKLCCSTYVLVLRMYV